MAAATASSTSMLLEGVWKSRPAASSETGAVAAAAAAVGLPGPRGELGRVFRLPGSRRGVLADIRRLAELDEVRDFNLRHVVERSEWFQERVPRVR